VLVEGYALDVVQVVEAVVLFLAVVVIALDLDKQIQFNFYLFVRPNEKIFLLTYL